MVSHKELAGQRLEEIQESAHDKNEWTIQPDFA
jgi:hypothetical protein